MPLRSAALLLLALLAPIPCAAQSSHGLPMIVVRGRIVNSAGQPIRNAAVRTAEGGRTAYADSTGEFVLRALRPSSGRLQLRVTRFAYEPLIVTRALRRGSVQEIGLLTLRGGVLSVDDSQIRGHPPDTSPVRKQKSSTPTTPD